MLYSRPLAARWRRRWAADLHLRAHKQQMDTRTLTLTSVHGFDLQQYFELNYFFKPLHACTGRSDRSECRCVAPVSASRGGDGSRGDRWQMCL
eukprot:COSAG05_NODE_13227_length_437_cov_1.804734_1_plen_92_part_10